MRQRTLGALLSLLALARATGAQPSAPRITTLVVASGAILHTNDQGGASLGLGGGFGVERTISPGASARLVISALRTVVTRDNVPPNCVPASACVTGVFPRWTLTPEVQALASPEASHHLWLVVGAGVAIPGPGYEHYRGAHALAERDPARATVRAAVELKLGSARDAARVQLSRQLYARGLYSMRSMTGLTVLLPL